MVAYSCKAFVNDSLDVTLTLVKCGTTIPIDISTATTMEIILKSKNVRLAKTATHVTDGTDGKIRAVVDADEISVPGRWEMQAHVVLPASPNLEYHSEKVTFQVDEVL